MLSPLTTVLMPIVGGYLVLSSLGLLSPRQAQAFYGDLSAHPGAIHAVGAVAVFVSLGILSFHRDWSTPPALTINAVALFWLVEGAGLLVSTNLLQRMIGQPSFAKGRWFVNLLLLAVGSYLLVMFGLGLTRS